jgi:hypothetical protein
LGAVPFDILAVQLNHLAFVCPIPAVQAPIAARFAAASTLAAFVSSVSFARSIDPASKGLTAKA